MVGKERARVVAAGGECNDAKSRLAVKAVERARVSGGQGGIDGALAAGVGARAVVWNGRVGDHVVAERLRRQAAAASPAGRCCQRDQGARAGDVAHDAAPNEQPAQKILPLEARCPGVTAPGTAKVTVRSRLSEDAVERQKRSRATRRAVLSS